MFEALKLQKIFEPTEAEVNMPPADNAETHYRRSMLLNTKCSVYFRYINVQQPAVV
jgi:hypothetical protein